MPLLPFLATSMPRTLLACGGVATVAMVGAGLMFHQAAPAQRAQPVCIDTVAPPVAPTVVPAATRRDPALSDAVKLVFTAGGTSYLKLDDVGNRETDDDEGRPRRANGLAMPRHGAARHVVEDDNTHASVAPVALADVPMMYASWLGRRFRVDAQCEASVVGFAVVSRLTGDPAYADTGAWTARSVMTAGQPVLAAKLDGCTGTLARDATLSPIVFPELRHDAALEQAARDQLLGSALAATTQQAWDVQRKDSDGSSPAKWTTDAEITTKVLYHPKTGKTFVSVQAAVPGSCGAPEANIWALYESTDHGLVLAAQRTMSDIQSIDQLVDIDGDGTFELVGTPWINSEQLILRASGQRLESLATPFFGCPC